MAYIDSKRGGCGCRKMLGGSSPCSPSYPGFYGRAYDPYRAFDASAAAREAATAGTLPPFRPPFPVCDCLCGCYNPIPPIYTGPCPPGPDSGGCPAVGSGAVYGFFVHAGDVAVPAGGAISFSENHLPTCWGLAAFENGVLIGVRGAYLAAYTLVIPAGQTVNTELYLTLDGEVIEASRTTIQKTATNAPLYVTMQAFFWASAGSVLRLVSSNALSIDAPADTRTLATLTVYRAA